MTRPAMVLGIGARAEDRANARGHLLQPDADRPCLHARSHAAGAEQREEPEREPAADVAGHAQEQDQHPASECGPAAAVLRIFARPAHQRAGSRVGVQVGADVPVAGSAWNSPRTSKLLFEGGVLFNNKDFPTYPQPDNAADPDSLSRLRHGLHLGQLSERLRPQREPQLQLAPRCVVRHWFARVQDRRQLHALVGVDLAGRRQQRHGRSDCSTACRAR